MERSQIKNVLTTPYNRANWKEVIKAIFPGSDLYSDPFVIEPSGQLQEERTERILVLGDVLLDDDTSIQLIEVNLKNRSGIRINRNRVTLRNLVAGLVQPGITDGVLFVFVDPESPEWRFSFLSKRYEWDDGGDMKRKVTHPKRYTYVFGPGETVRTALDRFELLMGYRKRNLGDLLKAFSVEKISKEFFEGYKRRYRQFIQHLYEEVDLAALFPESDKKDKEAQQKLARDFVKKMLGRIIFIYFLQKKRWMGAPDQEYKGGDPFFFQNLFRGAKDQRQFYSKYLVPLFFEALNQKREGDLFALTGNCIPFLNGSLFHNDRPTANHLDFPPELFEDLIRFFDRYNFTVDEADPDDADVGIDPEMLGHIFENLLEENWKKGTFYTPKNVVQYMCQETLRVYLEQKVGKNEELTQFVRTGIRLENAAWLKKNAPDIDQALRGLRVCDPAIGSGAFPMGMLQEIFKLRTGLNWSIDPAKTKVEIIRDSIYGVDLEKGAVDIARLRFYLSLVLEEELPSPLPNLDYKIMQGNSLFESFRDISLHVAEEGKPQQISLFGDWQDQKSVSDGLKKELFSMINAFFALDDPDDKERQKQAISQKIIKAIEKALKVEKGYREKEVHELKKDLEGAKKSLSKAQWQKVKNKSRKAKAYQKALAKLKELDQAGHEIRSYLHKEEKPYFLWHLYFKQVMEDGGFHIIIGNPPYIRQEELKRKGIKPWLEQFYPEMYNSVADIYTYFFAKGQKLLREGGLLCYICSKQYTRARFGEPLRRFLNDKMQLLSYLNFEDVKIFAATVDTSVVLLKNGKTGKEEFQFVPIKNDLDSGEPIYEYAKAHGFNVSVQNLTKERWVFLPPNVFRVKSEIEKNHPQLAQLEIQINWGIKTGYNKAFVITGDKKADLLSEILDSTEKDDTEKLLKPFLRGKDIFKWEKTDKDNWLIFTRRGVKIDGYPSLKNYLAEHYEQLKPKQKGDLVGRKPGSYKWYEIQDNIAYWPLFLENEKLIWGEISETPNFYLDSGQYFSNNKTVILTGENIAYLSAILNSSVVGWYYRLICPFTGEGTPRWEKNYVQQIPVPIVGEETKAHLKRIVIYLQVLAAYERITDLVPNSRISNFFEEVLNGCVYELYFPEHMAERDLCILDRVGKCLEPIEGKEEADQKEIVLRVYQKLKSDESGIRERMRRFVSSSPEILAIIEKSVY